jgi:tape measure domain-containing protein
MDLARLGLQVDSSDVRTATNDLSRFGREGKAASSAASNVEKTTGSMGGAFKGAALQIAGAVGAFASVQKALGAAEQYTNMQNRLLALGASHESAAAQIQQLADIAKDTRAPLESTVELYSRLSLTADSLGASQGELMEFTETVGLALAASGTSAGQASGALTQLSQAMAGGVVRAEEFNSMIEGAPGLLMAVANGIEGVNGDLGGLRQMMLDGELTSEAFFNALLSQNEALTESFERTSPTIASAFGVLNDQFTLFIGGADQATGVTTTIAEAMLLLAENMDVAVPVFGAVALGVAAISAPVLAAGVAIGALAVAVITHWNEIKAGFSAGVDYVLAAGKRFLDWVTPFAEMTPLGFLVINTVRYWDEIKKAFTDGVDFVVGLGPRLVDALKDAASQALDAALSIGTEIINGIKAGIDNKWQEIKDRILSLGDSLPNWLRESLGIASPAREMIPIGEYAIDGVIVGLDNREDALRLKSEGIGEQIGKGIKDGLDPVLETIFDGLAKGDLGSIGSRILSMGQGSFSGLLQSSASGGGNFLGNVFGGLQNAWGGVTSAIGGIASGATGIISGVGGAISSALPIVGAVSAVANLFKSTEVLVAEGVRVRMSETFAALDTYEKTKRENGFGFSSGFSRDFDEMDQAVQDALGARVAATIDNLEMFGLGTDLSGFEFSKRTEIKDGETLQGEMEEVIREALDAAVQYATEGALDGFTQTGETVSQALDRLAASLNGVNPVLDMLGQSLLPVSLDGAAAAASLLELAGGLEAFSTNAVFVFDNFLTDAEQQARLSAVAMDQLNAAFDDLNMDVPATHAAFMDLMDAQDLTTEAGRKTYSTLLNVAQAFVTVNGTAQEAADALQNAAADIADTAQAAQTWTTASNVSAVGEMAQITGDALTDAENALRAAFAAAADDVSAAYDQQINAARAAADAANAVARAQAAESERLRQERLDTLEAQADVLSDRVSVYRTISDALERAYTDRRVLTAIGQRMQLTNAQAFLRSAVASGGTTDVDRLEAALEAVENPSEALYGSFQEYQHDFNVNTNLIKALGEVQDDALSVEMRSLNALEEQIDTIRDAGREQVESIQANTQAIEDARDAELSALNAQMNALLGIDTSVMSVADAIANLEFAQSAAQAAQDAVDQQNGGDPNSPFAVGSRLWNAQNDPNSLSAEINRQYNQILGRNVDAAGLDFYHDLITADNNFGIFEMIEDLLKNRDSDVGIPAFARGGMHTGGLRIVGENGPELEATGPARIYSASQTRAMMGSGKEVEELRRTNSYLLELLKETRRQGKLQRTQDLQGSVYEQRKDAEAAT